MPEVEAQLSTPGKQPDKIQTDAPPTQKQIETHTDNRSAATQLHRVFMKPIRLLLDWGFVQPGCIIKACEEKCLNVTIFFFLINLSHE